LSSKYKYIYIRKQYKIMHTTHKNTQNIYTGQTIKLNHKPDELTLAKN